MTIEGIIQNGVVVLPAGSPMPEGARVSVTFAAQQATPPREQMSDEHRLKLLAALDGIAALTNEKPGDTFSGTDHDNVLYGERIS